MMLNQREKTVNIDNITSDRLLGMMLSEEYFWLMTALASACAEEELVGYLPNAGLDTQKIVELFNKTLRAGKMEQESLNFVRLKAWEKVTAINKIIKQKPIYEEKISLLLSKAFVSYWLIFQLIQSEWQQKIDAEELADTYVFLDGLLADGAELEKIEQKMRENIPLSRDQKLYLRSNWQRVHIFWDNLYEEIFLRLFDKEETRGMICQNY